MLIQRISLHMICRQQCSMLRRTAVSTLWKGGVNLCNGVNFKRNDSHEYCLMFSQHHFDYSLFVIKSCIWLESTSFLNWECTNTRYKIAQTISHRYLRGVRSRVYNDQSQPPISAANTNRHNVEM